MRVLGIFALAAILLFGMGASVGFAGARDFDDERFFFARGFGDDFFGKDLDRFFEPRVRFFGDLDRFDDLDKFDDDKDDDKDADDSGDPMFDFLR